MGNIIGSVHWGRSDNDIQILDSLDKLRRKHKLEIDTHPFHTSIKYINEYGVQISGWSVLWYGEQNAKNKIKAFLSEQLFRKNNIGKYDTYQGHLPM